MIKFYGFYFYCFFANCIYFLFQFIFSINFNWYLQFCYSLRLRLSPTAGTVENSKSSERGALLAVHSIVGFTGGAIGGPLIGLTLDIFGGQQDINAWRLYLFV